MSNKESVLLSYENKDRVAYQALAEFLRLLGFFVCEDVRYEADSEPEFEINVNDYDLCYMVDSTSPIDYVGITEYLLAKDMDWDMQRSICYEQLYSIYSRCNLLQASVTLQYYRIKHEEIKNAGDNFVQAADALELLIKANPGVDGIEQIRYAKLYCKQKANLAYFLYGGPVAYYVNDLAAEGLALVKEYPWFANAWALLGFIYEISKDYAQDAVDAFQRAIDMVGEKPYISSLYYWLGRRCEDYDALIQSQYDAYQRAYKLMPKYRNIYKIARMYLVKADWNNALKYFEECLEKIEKKGTYLDPLEQEYYFKVNVHISYIYLKLKDYYNAIIRANRALDYSKQIAKRADGYVSFYQNIYGVANANKYINITVSHMQPRQIWNYLAIAYQESGMQEEADRYWNLFKG